MSAAAVRPVASRADSVLIGYARVSTDLQSLDLQLDALAEAGAERVYHDTGSGSLKHRPQLDACLDYLRTGDTLVVWRLDRLVRGLKHLIDLVEQLDGHDIGFRSLTEQIDTTTPAGRLQFHLFGALAEFEREIIRERTRAGLTAARARGRTGGRPIALTPEKVWPRTRCVPTDSRWSRSLGCSGCTARRCTATSIQSSALDRQACRDRP